MRAYTAHVRTETAPVLVREGFSLGAFLFGPIWLFCHRAWIPGVLLLCLSVAVGLLAPSVPGLVLSLALMALAGMFGRDLVRWSLYRRGFDLAHVVVARDADAALARLLEQRPALAEDAAA